MLKRIRDTKGEYQVWKHSLALSLSKQFTEMNSLHIIYFTDRDTTHYITKQLHYTTRYSFCIIKLLYNTKQICHFWDPKVVVSPSGCGRQIHI